MTDRGPLRRARAHALAGRRVAALTLAALAVVLAATSAAAQAPAADSRFERLSDVQNYTGFVPASLDSTAMTSVILQLKGNPVAKAEAEARKQGKELSNAQKAAIRADLKSRQGGVESRVRGLGGQVLFDYQDAYNGVAVKVPRSALPELMSLSEVEAVHPSRLVERENIPGIQYITANQAWADLGFTGDGVTIAVIDTGVDYTHANFGGPGTVEAFENNDSTTIADGGFPTAKVIGGTDFAGDDYDASSDDPAVNTPQPDPDPLDCNGHGSHVAGSAAGFGVLDNGSTYPGPYDGTTYSNDFRIGPGAAPEAKILAYRVFGCEGSASDAVVVAAINKAVMDDADVISMSLGSVFGRPDAPDSIAANNAAESGHVVVAAAGNAGPSGYIADGPGIADRAVSVAAIDGSSPTFPGANLALSTGPTVPAQNSNGATLPAGPLQIAVLRTSYPDGPVALGCDPADYANYPGGVAGKLVVTVRGVCARVARAIFGEQAGAAAVVMVNTSNTYPPFEGEITSNPDTGEKFTVTIPFLGVRGLLGPAASDDGDNLVAADGGTTTLTATTVPNPGYGFLASFSSGGPRNVDSGTKPDVTAPGVSVLSTAVGTGNQGSRNSGTSMATPMTSGAAALILEAHPSWSPEQVKAALINTANSTSKINGYNVRTAGSGVVDARRAVDTVGLITTQDGRGNLAYGTEALSSSYEETLPLTIWNTGSTSITYNLASAFNGSALGATMTLSDASVTLPAGGSKTVTARLALSGAAVAALPGAETSNFGSLVTVRGAVTATPTSPGDGIYPLRVPFLVAPRGLSSIAAGPKSSYVKGAGSLRTATLPLSNSGIHAGTADLYAWGIHDADDISGAEDGMDIRDVGVQVLPGEALGGTEDDRSLVFAVNMYGKWSNPSVSEVDIAIDLQNNGKPDYFVVGVDLGAVTTGTYDGRYASFTIDAAGNLIDAFVADAPMNGSTMLLPALASEIGLGMNSTKFNYAVAAFSIVPGVLVDQTGAGTFRSHDPPISTGDFASLASAGSTSWTLSVDKGKLAGAPQLGWLVVSHDDANGAAQADEVPIGSVP